MTAAAVETLHEGGDHRAVGVASAPDRLPTIRAGALHEQPLMGIA